MKFRPVVAELFPEKRRTDMAKLTAAFRNFANAHENEDSQFITCHTKLATAPNTSASPCVNPKQHGRTNHVHEFILNQKKQPTSSDSDSNFQYKPEVGMGRFILKGC